MAKARYSNLKTRQARTRSVFLAGLEWLHWFRAGANRFSDSCSSQPIDTHTQLQQVATTRNGKVESAHVSFTKTNQLEHGFTSFYITLCHDSHHTTPHHTTPHRIAPHRTAPHRIAPNRIASHRIASHHITSHHTRARTEPDRNRVPGIGGACQAAPQRRAAADGRVHLQDFCKTLPHISATTTDAYYKHSSCNTAVHIVCVFIRIYTQISYTLTHLYSYVVRAQIAQICVLHRLEMVFVDVSKRVGNFHSGFL